MSKIPEKAANLRLSCEKILLNSGGNLENDRWWNFFIIKFRNSFSTSSRRTAGSSFPWYAIEKLEIHETFKSILKYWHLRRLMFWLSNLWNNLRQGYFFSKSFWIVINKNFIIFQLSIKLILHQAVKTLNHTKLSLIFTFQGGHAP